MFEKKGIVVEKIKILICRLGLFTILHNTYVTFESEGAIQAAIVIEQNLGLMIDQRQ